MVWEDGRYVITFNGEIYNYQALRDELEQGGPIALNLGHGNNHCALRTRRREDALACGDVCPRHLG